MMDTSINAINSGIRETTNVVSIIQHKQCSAQAVEVYLESRPAAAAATALPTLPAFAD